MHHEYTQLPSAEAVAASSAAGLSDAHLLAAASASAAFGCHSSPYSNAPYQQCVGSHSQSYEPAHAAAEGMSDHGVTASSLYHQATRKRGRPPGSKNKPHVGPPKTRKGRSHDDDWYQGKFALQPNVSMVCLAAVDKRTGYASRGAPEYPRRHLSPQATTPPCPYATPIVQTSA